VAVTVTPAAVPQGLPLWAKGPYGPISGQNYHTISDVFGNKRAVVAQINFSGTYVTGGFAITPATWGLVEIHDMFLITDGAGVSSALPGIPTLSTTGASPNVKIWTAIFGELANATSLASTGVTVIFVGY
jgi:hypothetical protein